MLQSPSKCFVQDRTSHKVIGLFHRPGGLYVLNQFNDSIVAISIVDISSFHLSSSFSSPFYFWHSCLGHISSSRLKFLASTRVLSTLDSHDIFYSSGCKLVKVSTLPFNKSISSSLTPFNLVHSYVWGPSPVSTKGGFRFYVSFIDDFTHFT